MFNYSFKIRQPSFLNPIIYFADDQNVFKSFDRYMTSIKKLLAPAKENEINTKNDIREMYELIKAFSKIREETYVLVDSDDHDYKRMTLKELNSKLDNV